MYVFNFFIIRFIFNTFIFLQLFTLHFVIYFYIFVMGMQIVLIHSFSLLYGVLGLGHKLLIVLAMDIYIERCPVGTRFILLETTFIFMSLVTAFT